MCRFLSFFLATRTDAQNNQTNVAYDDRGRVCDRSRMTSRRLVLNTTRVRR